MRYLATYEAQARVDVQEWKALSSPQQALWTAILLACQSPGIPLDAPPMQAQLQYIWKPKGVTYSRLLQG